MFILTKNNLVDAGKCWYEDEHGNSVFVKKGDADIVLKLRFADKNMKAYPLTINFPLPDDEDGVYLSLYPDSREYYNSTKDLPVETTSAIEDFNKLIQYWINLMYDILYLNSVQFIADEKEKKEQFSSIYEDLKKYDELKPLFNQLFEVENHI